MTCINKWTHPGDELEFDRRIVEIAKKLQFLKTLQENPEYERTSAGREIEQMAKDDCERLRQEFRTFVSTHNRQVKAGGRGLRSDQKSNVEKIRALLWATAQAMLQQGTSEARERMRREVDSGKFIAMHAEVRAGTVGEILDLKGKNAHPDACAQTLFEICRNVDTFRLFEDYAKAQGAPLARIAPETFVFRFTIHLNQVHGKGPMTRIGHKS